MIDCHRLAETVLTEAGWTHDQDIRKLAQNLQDTIDDYLADLQFRYEEEQREQFASWQQEAGERYEQDRRDRDCDRLLMAGDLLRKQTKGE